MRIRALMIKDPITILKSASIKDALDLMTSHSIRHLPVINEDGELVGLLTHRDLLRVCVSSIADISRKEQDALLRGIPAEQIMTAGVLTVSPNSDVRSAAELMLDRKIGCLPVVDGRKLVGILTEADFVRYLLEILQ